MPGYGVTKRADGFRRVKYATRWLATGAAVLVGVFSLTAAREAGAKSTSAPAPQPVGGGTSATTPSTVPNTDPYAGQGDQSGSSSQGDQSLQTPATLPQQSYQSPVASSGGS